MLELLLMGISGLASSPLLDFLPSDDEDDDDNHAAQNDGVHLGAEDDGSDRGGLWRASGGMAEFLRDGEGAAGFGGGGSHHLGVGAAFSKDFGFLGRGGGFAGLGGGGGGHGGSGDVLISTGEGDAVGPGGMFDLTGLPGEAGDWFDDAQRALAETEVGLEDNAAIDMPGDYTAGLPGGVPDAHGGSGDVFLVSDDGVADWTEPETSEEDGVVEMETYFVGTGPGTTPIAEVTDFTRGEGLLEVTIYTEEGVEDVDVEIEPTEDGESSILKANGQSLAVVLGVPELDFDDLRINFEVRGGSSGESIEGGGADAAQPDDVSGSGEAGEAEGAMPPDGDVAAEDERDNAPDHKGRGMRHADDHPGREHGRGSGHEGRHGDHDRGARHPEQSRRDWGHSQGKSGSA